MANKTITDFARQQIIDGLAKLPSECQVIFLRMYNHKVANSPNPEQYIDETINNIPDEKLDWALSQVQRSLEKRNL